MKSGTDYIGVGVGAIIVDEQGRLFLARRGPKAKNERVCGSENLENYVKLKDRTPAHEEPWL